MEEPQSRKYQLKYFSKENRGYVATEDIKKGENIMTIPQKYLLSNECFLNENLLGQVFKDSGLDKKIRPRAIMAAFLLFENY